MATPFPPQNKEDYPLRHSTIKMEEEEESSSLFPPIFQSEQAFMSCMHFSGVPYSAPLPALASSPKASKHSNIPIRNISTCSLLPPSCHHVNITKTNFLGHVYVVGRRRRNESRRDFDYRSAPSPVPDDPLFTFFSRVIRADGIMYRQGPPRKLHDVMMLETCHDCERSSCVVCW